MIRADVNTIGNNYTVMIKEDYNLQMENVISHLGDKRPRLLLHTCCAPCACGVIGRLEAFDFTMLYYNPNIDTIEEYTLRAEQLDKLSAKKIICDYNPSEFLAAVCGLENQPEGGKRCFECIKMRLEYTAKYASLHGYEWFCSSLSVSPHKNAELINSIGFALSQKYGVKFLPNDFKKRNGYINSVSISNKLGIYRQRYCGCAFSKQ